MIHKINLDHCVIHVSNWEISNTFYRDVLGAEVVPINKGFSYRFGNAQLNCHGPDVTGLPAAKIPVKPGGSDLCFIWPDSIEIAITHLKKHNITIEVGPVQRFGNHDHGTSVYFRDPDGSLMEFISYENLTSEKK